MSKIYEALEQEERRRKELDRPTIRTTHDAVTAKVPAEPIKAQPPELWEPKDDKSDQEMVDLYYSISALTLHKPGQIIQFVASNPGEGSTTVAEEFGRVSASELGKTVLLLKADDHPMHGNQYNNDSQPIFDRLLHNGSHVEEIFQKDGSACFFVCPVIHQNSISALISSPKVDNVFEKLREHFDLILVDTPSVSGSATGLAMCRKADGVVLVVEAENTRVPSVQTTKHKIQKAGGNILGVVLNKYRSHLPGSIAGRL